MPSVHLHGTLTLGLLGPESRLYRGGTPRRSLDWLGLRSRPHEGGTPRRSLDWLGWLGILAFGWLGMHARIVFVHVGWGYLINFTFTWFFFTEN